MAALLGNEGLTQVHQKLLHADAMTKK